MFEHIASNINVEYPVRGPMLMEYGHTHANTFNGIRYFDTRQANVAWSLLDAQYHQHWTLSFMEITGPIVPHTDSGAKTVINVYGNAGDGVTRFYRSNMPHMSGTKIKNQTNGRVFERGQLTEVGQFVARDNDAWILDVSKIHAVDMPADRQRWAYCLSTVQPYAQARRQVICRH